MRRKVQEVYDDNTEDSYSESNGSQEVSDNENIESSLPVTKKRRGPTRCKDLLEKTTLIPLSVNELGQPIGDDGTKYANFLGTIARNGRRCYKNWWEMPDQLKEDMWNIVMGKFEVGTIIKKWTLTSIATKWRGFKCDLKSKYYSVWDTDVERLAHPPPLVEKDHWEFLVKHWSTDKAKEQSQKNKESRGKQKMLHTTGTKSFARVSAEIEAKEGRKPSRAELFCRTHVHKDGTAIDSEAADLIMKINDLSEAGYDNGDSSNDLFSQLTREERRGRVRMYGLGPTPSDIWGPSPTRAELIRKAKQSEEEARVARVELHDTISSMQAKYDEKLERLQQRVDMLMSMHRKNSSGQVSDSSNPQVSPHQVSSHGNSSTGNSNQMGKSQS